MWINYFRHVICLEMTNSLANEEAYLFCINYDVGDAAFAGISPKPFVESSSC